MVGTIDMNVSVFWKTPAGILKSAVLQHFPKYRQKYVNLNVKTRPKLNGPDNFLTFEVLKILDNLVSMQGSLNANN